MGKAHAVARAEAAAAAKAAEEAAEEARALAEAQRAAKKKEEEAAHKAEMHKKAAASLHRAKVLSSSSCARENLGTPSTSVAPCQASYLPIRGIILSRHARHTPNAASLMAASSWWYKK